MRKTLVAGLLLIGRLSATAMAEDKIRFTDV